MIALQAMSSNQPEPKPDLSQLNLRQRTVLQAVMTLAGAVDRPTKKAVARIAQAGEVLSRLETTAPPGTLERLYLDEIKPQFEAQLGFDYMEEIDRALARWTVFRPGCTPVGDLSEVAVIDFQNWLQTECGYSKWIATKSGRAIRRIIRAIDPALVIKARKGGMFEEAADPDSLQHFFTTIYHPKRLHAKSPATARLYVNTLRNFHRYLGRKPLMSDLNDDALRGFLDWHIKDRGNSPHSANKDAGQLQSMARYAFRKKLIETEPELMLLRAPNRVPLAWQLEELSRLFSAIDKLQGNVGKTEIPNRVWWRALMLTIFYTGERINALLMIEWKDVDINGGCILIPGQYRKGQRNEKVFEVAKVAVKALKELKDKSESNRVFPWPLSTATLYDRLKMIHRRAGLPRDRRDMFHRMRRTCASWFKKAGGDPSELLDHADPKTTKRYIDPRICSPASAADLLPDPTKGDGKGGDA